jgi:hypothetical protein
MLLGLPHLTDINVTHDSEECTHKVAVHYAGILN